MTIKEVSEQFGLTQDTLRYYERIGMIPKVNRTPSGIRDYNEQDLAWVNLAKCMRAAGLAVEGLVEYVKLYQEGDSTMQARMDLLIEQRETLIKQKTKIDDYLEKLDYKIESYEKGIKTGVLEWKNRF